jgi:hypothetical protein
LRLDVNAPLLPQELSPPTTNSGNLPEDRRREEPQINAEDADQTEDRTNHRDTETQRRQRESRRRVVLNSLFCLLSCLLCVSVSLWFVLSSV